ncbi:hypothetical protein WR164_03070 [Philodulcilactobacillus myokoensis]|uniref:Uncharacterized protein n=1 Tax=Philodulcilactobacillus myokoensis TaxID=2929573 RepID=A0A9W6ESH1_9LACO|nr:hypothetical protein [Philodulcilactobacillus myokoensis]GLB46328.1 hypothetical protein WR164_03070 [Philodulcilactobacillus myokoensis]
MKINQIVRRIMVGVAALSVGGLMTSNVSAHSHYHHKRTHRSYKKIRHHKRRYARKKKSAVKHHQARLVVNKWYAGVPHDTLGTWYHNDNDLSNCAYITYQAKQTSGNYVVDDNGKSQLNAGSGILNPKYRYLGGHTYQIRGVEYQRDAANPQILSEHMYYSYKVDVYKNRLHFHLGHGIRDYVKNPNSTIKNFEK